MKRDEAAPVDRPGGFDENERDTAPRAYSQEMVDSVRYGTPNEPPPPVKRSSDIQATAKIDRFELEAVLRKESGTRPAVTTDEIERFMENGVAPAFDPHSRPTVEAIPRSIIEAAEGRAPAPVIMSMPTPTPISRIQPAPVTRLPRWVLPLVAVGVGIVVTLAFGAGFVVGRFVR